MNDSQAGTYGRRRNTGADLLGAIRQFIAEFAPFRAVVTDRSAAESQCGAPHCTTNQFDLFCEHDSVVKSIADSGVLFVLAAFAGLIAGLSSWVLARHLVELHYTLTAVVAFALTSVVLWSLSDQRKVASLQCVAVYTIVGVGTQLSSGSGSVGIMVALALTALGGLLFGTLSDSDYAPRDVVRLVLASGALALMAISAGSALAGASHIKLLFTTDVGLAAAFFVGFFPEATIAAMRRPISYKVRVPEYRRGEAPHNSRRLPNLSGPLAMLSILGNQVVVGTNSATRMAHFAGTTLLQVTSGIARAVEYHVARVTIRTGQTVVEAGAAITKWCARTVQILDHRLLPSVAPVGAFAIAALLCLVGTRLASAYVGSGDGLSRYGWFHLAQLSGVAVGVILSMIAAWASFGEPFPRTLRSVSRSALHLSTAGAVIVGGYTLATDVGLPALRLMPFGDSIASSPYTFGPGAALSLAGLLWVILWVLLSGKSEPADDTDQAGLNIAVWSRRLASVITALELRTFWVPLVVAGAFGSLAVTGSAAFVSGH